MNGLTAFHGGNFDLSLPASSDGLDFGCSTLLINCCSPVTLAPKGLGMLRTDSHLLMVMRGIRMILRMPVAMVVPVEAGIPSLRQSERANKSSKAASKQCQRLPALPPVTVELLSDPTLRMQTPPGPYVTRYQNIYCLPCLQNIATHFSVIRWAGPSFVEAFTDRGIPACLRCLDTVEIGQTNKYTCLNTAMGQGS